MYLLVFSICTKNIYKTQNSLNTAGTNHGHKGRSTRSGVEGCSAFYTVHDRAPRPAHHDGAGRLASAAWGARLGISFESKSHAESQRGVKNRGEN